MASPEDVLVAVSGRASSEDLIRRGARLARRLGGSCIVVTVRMDGADGAGIERFRELSGELGASFAVLGGTDIASAVIQAARDAMVEHVVVGEMGPTSGWSRLRPTLADQIIDGLPDSDVHVIARWVQ
jgi:two-component system sensor histidine kinase KdpD